MAVSFFEAFTFSNGGRIMFSQLSRNQNVLISYDDTTKANELFQAALYAGPEENRPLVYIFDEKNNKINLSWAKKHGIILWPLKNWGGEDISSAGARRLINSLSDLYSTTERSATDTRVLIDWGIPKNYGASFEQIVYFIKELLTLQKQPWKRHFKTRPRVSRHTNINAFNASALTEEAFEKLSPLHQKIFYTSDSFSFASFPTSRTGQSTISRVTSTQAMEYVIKRNLEVIILSMLKEKPSCGYGVAKKIFNSFRVLIPLGTAYATLYEMEKRGVVVSETNGREKIYRVKPDALQYVENKIKASRNSYRHLLSFVS